MSLAYDFKKAVKIIDSLTQAESVHLVEICGEIQAAEICLNRAAEPALERCMSRCRGLCCRNIHLNQIIGVDDFVFLLTVERKLKPEMIHCLEHEQLFSADCIFLRNGTGPCLFPSHSKPKICICTFCDDDTAMKREIRGVGSKFNALSRFLIFRKSRAVRRRLRRILPRWRREQRN